ncbi:hypothetical protein [Macrococcus capreoli]|uniref:hypothetical protein n=1 Tax=Macrococcus capreoli TaxID=2982690 RepID=UPI0021D60E8B|nr:hypothetical protein [Macrococcus sp. TMW 2.2395]MCU7556493.1 hypothetical protein [Macrococcus sp. TMW 2.2395]
MKQEDKIIELAPVDAKIYEMVERIPRKWSNFVLEYIANQTIGNPRFISNFFNPKRFYIVLSNSSATLYDINEKLVVHSTDVTHLVDSSMSEIKFELDGSLFEFHKIVRK